MRLLFVLLKAARSVKKAGFPTAPERESALLVTAIQFQPLGNAS